MIKGYEHNQDIEIRILDLNQIQLIQYKMIQLRAKRINKRKMMIQMNKNNQAVMIGEIRVEIMIGIEIENKGQIIITNNGSMISLIVIPIITRM